MSITAHPPLIASGITPEAIAKWGTAYAHSQVVGNPHGLTAAALGLEDATLAGNQFNGASELVLLDSAGKLPALDASALTGSPIFATVTTPKATSAGAELLLEQTGDQLGTSRLHLQNRGVAAGALFENASLDVVDFGFLPSSGNQSNIRWDRRPANLINSGNTRGEFQFINVGTLSKWFVSGEAATVVNGLFGVNASTPGGQTQITIGALDRIGLLIKSASGQTGAPFSITDSVGASKAYFTAAGGLYLVSDLQMSNGSINCRTINDPGSATYSRLYMGGSSKWLKVNTNNIDRIMVDANGLSLAGAQGVHGFYLGDPSVDGSWRLQGDGTNLLIQKRVSGAWATKSTIAG